jgi:hypothetical protein
LSLLQIQGELTFTCRVFSSYVALNVRRHRPRNDLSRHGSAHPITQGERAGRRLDGAVRGNGFRHPFGFLLGCICRVTHGQTSVRRYRMSALLNCVHCLVRQQTVEFWPSQTVCLGP